MPQKRRPRHGSMAYSPRKRARREVPHISSWPEASEGPRLQAFAGYKAGMTHVLLVDYRPSSTTAGQEIQVPVTVVESPPMRVAAVRVYRESPQGLQAAGEVWAKEVDAELRSQVPLPKKRNPEAAWARLDGGAADDVRLLMYTQPRLVDGLPKSAPDLMETRVGGGTVEERLAYGRDLLGKEVPVGTFAEGGQVVDVVAVTKGKGFQGAVKRWGIKILSHKDSKIRRRVGTLGTFKPGYTRPTVPQAGQVGYHQRTEYNKIILKVGEDGAEVTPEGGFMRYGAVRNAYMLVKGSVPGPAKRLVRFRDPMRAPAPKVAEEPELTYVSLTSKQGG